MPRNIPKSNRLRKGGPSPPSTGNGRRPGLRLRVSADAERHLRFGHPWLFADSVREQNRPGTLGELAAIYDRRDRFLAIGLFDPDSPLRVRVLQAGKPVPIDAAWWRDRFRETIGRRDSLFDARTTGYRLIHGESDGWPGLVLDRYDATLVLKLYTAAWLPRLGEVVGLARHELGQERVVLRLSRNVQGVASDAFGVVEGLLASGNDDESARRSAVRSHSRTGLPECAPPVTLAPVVFRETGLRFEADVLRGQKTGFFLDQRENRRIIESLARGRDVLNAFSFTGGFSVYAARGGARSVCDLDISEHALAGSRRNFALNTHVPAVAACPQDTIQADAFDWLGGNSRKFDLVVLDPPSLAKREAERSGAIAAYHNLARAGIQRLEPGGILVAASCSAHVSDEEFFAAVRRAARHSRRTFAELRTTGHPPDHPATFTEARYLKCIYLRL